MNVHECRMRVRGWDLCDIIKALSEWTALQRDAFNTVCGIQWGQVVLMVVLRLRHKNESPPLMSPVSPYCACGDLAFVLNHPAWRESNGKSIIFCHKAWYILGTPEYNAIFMVHWIPQKNKNKRELNTNSRGTFCVYLNRVILLNTADWVLSVCLRAVSCTGWRVRCMWPAGLQCPL